LYADHVSLLSVEVADFCWTSMILGKAFLDGRLQAADRKAESVLLLNCEAALEILTDNASQLMSVLRPALDEDWRKLKILLARNRRSGGETATFLGGHDAQGSVIQFVANCSVMREIACAVRLGILKVDERLGVPHPNRLDEAEVSRWHKAKGHALGTWARATLDVLASGQHVMFDPWFTSCMREAGVEVRTMPLVDQRRRDR
jgi:hypothetical protein